MSPFKKIPLLNYKKVALSINLTESDAAQNPSPNSLSPNIEIQFSRIILIHQTKTNKTFRQTFNTLESSQQFLKITVKMGPLC